MTTTACTRRSSHGQEAEADGEKNVAEVGELNAGGERGLIATQSEAGRTVVTCREHIYLRGFGFKYWI